MHVARCVQNSSNSLGDGVVRGRGVCVPGETKALSTSTRCVVRRPAVGEFAHPQQTPHVETWEGLLCNQGPKIFREVEIVPGCAVQVACPTCPEYSPEPPGPGRAIRNMLGWSQLERTERSGVWLFRGALQGKNLFSSFDVAGDWEKKGSHHTAWGAPVIPHALVRACGHGPAMESGAVHCKPECGGLSHPSCSLGVMRVKVPTAANLNLYRGWASCVGWHCDDEPLFGESVGMPSSLFQ